MVEAADPQSPALVGYRGKKDVGMPKTGIFVLIGLPKSGKSQLAASFPDSYVLELDKGDADHIAGRIHDIDEVKDAQGLVVKSKVQVFRETLLAVMKEPSIKTVVIDTVDTLAGLFMDEIAASHGLASMSVREKGVNTRDLWGELKSKFEGIVGYFQECGKLVIVCGHCKNPDKDENGTVIIPAGINVPGQSGNIIAGRAKLIGYCYKKEVGNTNAYYVTFNGGPLGIWGSRVDELNDKTIQLPRENGYSAIEALFKVPLKEPEATDLAKDGPGTLIGDMKAAAAQAEKDKANTPHKPAPRARKLNTAGVS